MSDPDKIHAALAGVQPLTGEEPDRYGFRNVSIQNHDPPSYIVRTLFLNVLGCRDFGGEEKVSWLTYFRFKGHTFMLRDFKFGSWSIETDNKDATTDKVLEELKGRIRHASSFVDRILYDLLKEQVDRGCFFLQNHYSTLASLYAFLEAETKDALGKYDALDAASPAGGDQSGIMDRFNRRIKLDRNTSFYAGVCQESDMTS